jgi:hypothetical protein
MAGIIIGAFSGFGVGAAQWMLMRGRLDVSGRGWILGTGCGAFLALWAQFYFGFPFFKAALDFPDLVGRFGYGVPLFTLIAVTCGGVALGVPQAAALRYTDVRARAWLPVTTLGILVAWLASLGLWSTLLETVGISGGDWPRPLRIIGGFVGYWASISIPQAFVMGRALRGRVRLSLDSPE